MILFKKVGGELLDINYKNKNTYSLNKAELIKEAMGDGTTILS